MVVRELEIHSSAIHPNIIQLYAAFEVRDYFPEGAFTCCCVQQ